MALNWTMKLKDEISGPAAAASGKLSLLEKKLAAVRKESERQKRLESAVAKQIGPKRAQVNLHGVELAGVKKLTAAYKGLNAAKSAGSRAASFVGGSGPMTDMLDRAGGVAGGAALAGAGLAGAGALKFGMMIQDAQQFKSDTMFALTTILKSKEAAAAAYAMASKTAMETGTDFRSSMSGFNTLVAQGFDVKFADQLVRAMADLQTLNPQANMEGITRAISQIKSTGRLQGDELMQLAEAGLNVDAVYKEIAKSMGIVDKIETKGKGKDKVTRIVTAGEQVKDLQADGAIDSKTAINAIMASLKKQVDGKDFGETAKARADKSLKGAAIRALTMKEAFLSSVNIDWSPISSGLERITAAMTSPAGEKFAERIGGAFSRVIGLLDDISDKDIEAFLDGAGSAFETGAETAVQMASALGQLSDSYSSVDSKFQSVAGISIFQAAMGSIVFSVQMASAALDGLGVAIDYAILLAESSAGSIGNAMIDGIQIAIESGASAVADSLVSAVEGAVEAAEAALGIASPSKVTRKMFNHVMDGAVLGTDDGVPALTAASERMAAAPLEAGRTLRTAITNNTTNTNSTSTRGNHFAPGAIQVNAIDPAQALEAALRQAVIAA